MTVIASPLAVTVALPATLGSPTSSRSPPWSANGLVTTSARVNVVATPTRPSGSVMSVTDISGRVERVTVTGSVICSGSVLPSWTETTMLPVVPTGVSAGTETARSWPPTEASTPSEEETTANTILSLSPGSGSSTIARSETLTGSSPGATVTSPGRSSGGKRPDDSTVIGRLSVALRPRGSSTVSPSVTSKVTDVAAWYSTSGVKEIVVSSRTVRPPSGSVVLPPGPATTESTAVSVALWPARVRTYSSRSMVSVSPPFTTAGTFAGLRIGAIWAAPGTTIAARAVMPSGSVTV